MYLNRWNFKYKYLLIYFIKLNIDFITYLTFNNISKKFQYLIKIKIKKFNLINFA